MPHISRRESGRQGVARPFPLLSSYYTPPPMSSSGARVGDVSHWTAPKLTRDIIRVPAHAAIVRAGAGDVLEDRRASLAESGATAGTEDRHDVNDPLLSHARDLVAPGNSEGRRRGERGAGGWVAEMVPEGAPAGKRRRRRRRDPCPARYDWGDCRCTWRSMTSSSHSRPCSRQW